MIPYLLATLAGAVGWSITEYTLHRFGAHHRRNGSRFQREHLTHHTVAGYFAPTSSKALTTLVAVPLVGGLAALVAGPALAVPFAVGFGATYLGYEFFHRRLHTHPPRTALGRALRLHHFQHHFGDARNNHGVTSRIWDRVAGTLQEPARPIRVPRRLAPAWLTSVDGGIPPGHEDDYVLIG